MPASTAQAGHKAGGEALGQPATRRSQSHQQHPGMKRVPEHCPGDRHAADTQPRGDTITSPTGHVLPAWACWGLLHSGKTASFFVSPTLKLKN